MSVCAPLRSRTGSQRPIPGRPAVCASPIQSAAAARMAIQMISSRYSSDCQRNHCCDTLFPPAPLWSVSSLRRGGGDDDAGGGGGGDGGGCSAHPVGCPLAAAISASRLQFHGRTVGPLCFSVDDALLRRSRASFSHASLPAGGPLGCVRDRATPPCWFCVGVASLSLVSAERCDGRRRIAARINSSLQVPHTGPRPPNCRADKIATVRRFGLLMGG